MHPNQRPFHFHWDVLLLSCALSLPNDTSRDTMLHYRRIPGLHIDRIPYSSLSLCFPHDLVNRTGTGNEASYSIFRFVLSGVCPVNAKLARANEFRYGKFYSCLRLYRHVLTLAMSKYSLVRMKCNWPASVWNYNKYNYNPHV